PATFDGSIDTVNGTYSLLPCAFSTSSRSHPIERSFGAGCPAAASSTILTMLWISFFCASSRFLSSLFCARTPTTEDARTTAAQSANMPRRCLIKPCLPMEATGEQPIIGGASRASQTLLPAALQTAVHGLTLCYHPVLLP